MIQVDRDWIRLEREIAVKVKRVKKESEKESKREKIRVAKEILKHMTGCDPPMHRERRKKYDTRRKRKKRGKREGKAFCAWVE